MKKFSNFVASIPQTVFMTIVSVAIFIATNNGYQIPLGCCTSKSVIVCGRTGGDSLSYTLFFRPMIPQTAKNASKAKNSNRTRTSNSTKTVSIKAFNIEKNAKNKAYYFILSHGLYNQFVNYCSNYHSINPHKDCVDYLLSKI